MKLSERQKQWIGALGSLAIQYPLFIGLAGYIGDLAAIVLCIATNMGLALSWRNKNFYLTGARWATFFALGAMTWLRHPYWYNTVLENFIRLRDLYVPLEWNELLCQGTPEDMAIVGISSAMITIFYSLVMRWDDWHGRWEMLRRALFSSSLGLQAMIAVAVIYPTPLTIILSLFFAAVISPILRRQVRFNHVIFLLLPPMFALSVPGLAFWAVAAASILFLFFASIERSKTSGIASFTFFCGMAFLGLTLSLMQSSYLSHFEGVPTASKVGSIAFFAATIGLSYLLVYRGEAVVLFLRRLTLILIPARLQRSSWWRIRDLWVDQEVDCRVNKRYNFKAMKFSFGMIFFGPRDWAPESYGYERKDFSRFNLTPSVLVLSLYSVWLLVDAILLIADISNMAQVIGLFLGGFIVVIGAPGALFLQQRKDREFYRTISVTATVLSGALIGLMLLSVFYYGLVRQDAIDSGNLQPRPADPNSGQKVPYDCPCKDEPLSLSRYL